MQSAMTQHMLRKQRVSRRLALALAALLAGAGLVIGGASSPATATLDPPVLHCDTKPANGPVTGSGSAEHAELQANEYIPAHETRCAQTVGTVTFTQTPESVAIARFQAGIDELVGLNQPLSTPEWWSRVSHHLPLMIDGFVVAANVPCTNLAGTPVKFSARTLSLVYLGAISSWGHPVLVADNPWLLGCGAPIHRAAKFGLAWSTAVFKDYLSKGNPAFDVYEERSQLDAWPPTTNISCAGSSEADMVACLSTAGTISYVRYATAKANGLTPLLLTNGDGATPPPAANTTDTWPSNCPAAVPVELRTATALGPQLDWSTFSMTNGKGYPLCGFGYIVTQHPLNQYGQAGYENWKDHLRIMWSDTQQLALKDYGYAPLPAFQLAAIRNSPIMQP